MRAIALIGVLLALGRLAVAGETEHIRNASRHYELVIEVKTSKGEDSSTGPMDTVTGPAQVSIFKKGAKAPFQVLHLPNIAIERQVSTYDPKIDKKPRVLYGDDPNIVFEDFNFDGNEDLAICDGHDGGYGGPTYNVFLYNAASGRFVKSSALSALTRDGYLGLFLVDRQRRHLVAFQKDGAAWHERQTFNMVNSKPVLIEDVVEDQRDGPDVVTTKRLVHGRWVKSVRKH